MLRKVGSSYDGRHGLFLHGLHTPNAPVFVKVGYHEGLIDSDVWLAVQDKKSHKHRIPQNKEVKNSWLVGLMKCAHCGYCLVVNYSWNASHTKVWRYLLDSGAYHINGCVKKRLKTKLDIIEEKVLEAMKERIKALEIAKRENEKPDTETEMLTAEIIRIEDEIRCLMDKLAAADDVLFDYIQKRIKELHAKKAELETKLRSHARKHKAIDTAPLSEPLAHWDELTVQEKRSIAGLMIDRILISDETGIEIQFSI